MSNTHFEQIELTDSPHTASEDARVADYFALLKPRVMSLVVFTGLAGLALAPGEINPFIGFVALLCIAVGAGAAGALNMWYDADIDAEMERTRSRPIPTGRVAPAEALNLGVTLSLGSVAVMALAVNYTSALLLAVTIGFYLFIYTMWLKRRSPQNIVIGGAAGAFPPMIGWAAVTGSVSLESIILFLIIFMWTPPHFWALALYRSGDYEKVGVPMLPVVAGRAETGKQIFVYSLILAPIALLPTFMGFASLIYGGIAGVLTAAFLIFAWQVWRSVATVGGQQGHLSAQAEKHARKLFFYSILYLMLLFAALLAEGLFDLRTITG